MALKYGPEHPKNLIPELCTQFYHLGWVTGTGMWNFCIYTYILLMIFCIQLFKVEVLV